VGIAERDRAAAFGIYCAAVCFCEAELTDGLIRPADSGRVFPSKNALRLMGVLVEAKLFDRECTSLRVHDYLDHNKPRAQVEEEIQQHITAGQRGGKASAQARAQAAAQAKSNPLSLSLSLKKGQEIENVTERSELVKTLARYSGWNADAHAAKQEAAIRSDFPTLDLLSCARSWASWSEDAKTPPTNCWSSFRNWCKREAAKPTSATDENSIDYIMRKWK
jgi:hypothetical protein